MYLVFCLSSLILCSVSAWAFVNQYGVSVPDDYICRLDIPYKQTDTWIGYFDFYAPRNAAEPTPVVVNIHGGGWDHNQKEQEGGWKPFFANGIAVANMQYRLSTQALAPAALNDVQDMIRFLRNHASQFNINPDRILLMGASAGGHLALLGGYTCPDFVFGIIDRYGISDMMDYIPRSSSPKKFVGKNRMQDTAFINTLSPMRLVTHRTPPTLIIHGDSDRVVPYQQSLWLVDTLCHYGVYNRLFTVPEGGHGRFSKEYNRLVDDEVQDFLCEIGVIQSVNVLDFGAINDGVTLTTEALQKAIDYAASKNIRRVFVPAGIYLTGTIFMRSGIELHLDSAATILGSTNIADYPEIEPAFISHTNRYTNRCLIYAADLTDIALTGYGTINGQGDSRAFRVSADEPLLGILRRPYVIRFVNCCNIRIYDLNLLNSPAWMQQYLNCENLSVRGIYVESHNNYNNDGLDIDCCRHVRITDCFIRSDDDAICMKATNATSFCEDISISRCRIMANCNSVKIGTETNGDFRNIRVSDCHFMRPEFPTMYNRPHRALAGIALEITDGGTLEDVIVQNIRIDSIMSPIFIRLANRGRNYYDGGPSQPIGRLRDVIIRNVSAVAYGITPSAITSVAEGRVEDVLLDNIDITLPGGGTDADVTLRDIPEMEKAYPENLMYNGINCAGLYLRHTSRVKFNNVRFTCTMPDSRPLILRDDVIDE